MSWLNFNESLNSLKGQISTFANNVLADEEGDEQALTNDCDELKRICMQQEQEIQRLRKLERDNGIGDKNVNGPNQENSWDWESPQETNTNQVKENVSHLKNLIKKLEVEKSDLISQLELLDSEHQQNLKELVQKREQLQEENNEIKDKFKALKQQNIILAKEEERLVAELQKLKNNSNTNTIPPSEENTKKYRDLLQKNQKLQSRLDNFNKSEAEKKILYSELQKAKELVKVSELKSREDTENCEKLALILDTYEKQVSSLKSQLDDALKHQSESKDSSKTIENLNKSNQKLHEELETTLDMVRLLEKENEKIKQDLANATHKEKLESEELRFLLEERTREMRRLQENLEQISNSQKENKVSNDKLNHIYTNILRENLSKLSDLDLFNAPTDIPNDSNIIEFNELVTSVFNTIRDLKYKCDMLEKQNLELIQKKTELLTEKNMEIEKLLQNSENLSQDVLQKTEDIKVLEDECEELRSTNGQLEEELRDYKNFKLDTISESNEDNMVHLETQLEKANKRIMELEKLLSDKENILSKNAPLEDQLTISETQGQEEVEVQKTENDYRELLKMFDDLKIDYDLARQELKNVKDDLDITDQEKEELFSELEKLKTDFDNSLENADYQLTEANITIDTLKEEINSSKAEINKILEDKKELSMHKNELEKNIIDTKTELNDTREQLLNEENKRRELESQNRNLIEKLQNSKMAETSLKLQYDTLSRENNTLAESKKNLEITVHDMKTNIKEYEKNYTELLEKYDKILLKCEELNAKILDKENEIFRQNKELNRLEEENKDLQYKLSNEKREVDLKDKTTETEPLRKKSQTLAMDNNIQKIIADEKQNITDNIIVCGNVQDSSSKTRELEIGEMHNDMSHQEDIKQENFRLKNEVTNMQVLLNQSNDNIKSLESELQKISSSRNDLITMVTTKNQESLTYYNEIQRLTQVLQGETEKCLKMETLLSKTSNLTDKLEKLTDQNNFLKEKCDVLSRTILEEQSKYQKLVEEMSAPSEKEVNLNKQLERLQSHLMELEEHYTQELLQAEQQNSELRTKMDALERREKDSSTMYTSVSIRANQQVESLQSQLQMVTNQRDELRKKISDAEDQSNKQTAALSNLQFVLEQFQRDKEKDVQQETERIRRQIKSEKHIQDDLRSEISNLKSQLEESKQGLLAASRLSDQLELTKSQNVTLREEVTQLQEKLAKSENTIHKLTNQTDGKVEKSLVKSLVVGFLSSGNANAWNKDQVQILKIIATILDFNQQDHEKVKLNHTQGSWLGSMLFGQETQTNTSQESLSQAFIKFLETESKPKVVPSLLESSKLTNEQEKPSVSGTSTPARKNSRTSPIVLSEIVLPTFDDFGRSRNSSSILKDVLKDNSNR